MFPLDLPNMSDKEINSHLYRMLWRIAGYWIALAMMGLGIFLFPNESTLWNIGLGIAYTALVWFTFKWNRHALKLYRRTKS